MPRILFIQTTTTTENVPDDESLEDCLYDEDSGDLINKSGNCDHSCVDDKVIEIFFIVSELFCCCRIAVVDRMLVNPRMEFDETEVSSTETTQVDTTVKTTETPLVTVESSFDMTRVSSTKTSQEQDTTVTVTEMSVLPIITSDISTITPENTLVTDTILINLPTIESSFDMTEVSSTETTQVDTTIKVAELTALPAMRYCLHDYKFGDLISAGGNCHHSCIDGKVIELLDYRDEMFCCCKHSAISHIDTTLINLSTMESSFVIAESPKIDTTMTLTEMSILPSITTVDSRMYPEDQPIQDCTYNESVNLSTSCAPQTINKNNKTPDDEIITSNYDLSTLSDLLSIDIKSTDGIELGIESVKATEEPTTTLITSEQPTNIEQPTTVLIPLDIPTSIDDLTTKQAPPRVKLVRTTISSIDTEVEPIQTCLYAEDTGLITNTSGDCYESCDNGKYLKVFFNENNILFCCCK
ncbi:unnamed protein product [Diamesa hyperborea]